LKELAKVPAQERQRMEHFVFEEVAASESLASFTQVTKMKGYDHFYRARFGNYRLGIEKQGDVLLFKRALHRKDIYKFFP
jgi:mRNA interferase RelE/StbE